MQQCILTIIACSKVTFNSYTTVANATYTFGRTIWGYLAEGIGNKRAYFIILTIEVREARNMNLLAIEHSLWIVANHPPYRQRI
jgi:hypothetical protein